MHKEVCLVLDEMNRLKRFADLDAVAKGTRFIRAGLGMGGLGVDGGKGVNKFLLIM